MFECMRCKGPIPFSLAAWFGMLCRSPTALMMYAMRTGGGFTRNWGFSFKMGWTYHSGVGGRSVITKLLEIVRTVKRRRTFQQYPC